MCSSSAGRSSKCKMQATAAPGKNLPAIYHTPGFYLVDCGIGDVAVRKEDFKVNITHICTAAKIGEMNGIRELREQRKDIHFEAVRGGGKLAGCYIDFSTAIGLCDKVPLVAQSLLEVHEHYQRHTQYRKTTYVTYYPIYRMVV
jgi:hypothetical protein